MNKRKLLFNVLGSVMLLASCGGNVTSENREMDRLVSELMGKMTIEEKIGQLCQCAGGFATGPNNTRIDRTEDISKGLFGSMLNVSGVAKTRKYQEAAMKSRLQIPLIFGLDVIHGFRTGFPLPLAEAASFDLEAIERSARYSAREAAAAGLHWTFAPMVDIGWDARWGRVMEGAGEAPYYGVKVAKARVHGLQGDDLSDESTIMACIKHFAGYGAPIAGMGEMINHRYAADEKEAALKGITAGLDMEMVSECYSKNLKALVEEGKVDEKLVDDAVRRILEQKYKLGLFEDPFKYCNEEREKSVIGSK